MPKRFARIYEAVLQHCSPIAFGPPWDIVTPDKDCFRFEASAEDVAQSLLAKFDAQILLQSKVMMRSSDDNLTLNPQLISEDRNVIALRDRQNVVIDIITSRGNCRGSIPFFAMLEDAKMRQAAEQKNNTLFVVFSFQDLMLLRSLGISVTLASDLQLLNCNGLDLFATVTDAKFFADPSWLNRRKLPAPVYDSVRPEGNLGSLLESHYPLRLIFVAGSVFLPNCDIPPALTEIARHLTDAERYCKLRFSDVHVWWLSSEEVANLVFRQRLGDVKVIREFFSVVSWRGYRIADFVDPSSPPPRSDPKPDLCKTIGELIKISSQRPLNSDRERQYSKLKTTYDTIVDQELFRPMIEMALATEHPEEMNKQVVLAQLYKQLHTMQSLIETAMVGSGKTNLIDANAVLVSTSHLEAQRGLVEMISKLSKAVSKPENDNWGV